MGKHGKQPQPTVASLAIRDAVGVAIGKSASAQGGGDSPVVRREKDSGPGVKSAGGSTRNIDSNSLQSTEIKHVRIDPGGRATQGTPASLGGSGKAEISRNQMHVSGQASHNSNATKSKKRPRPPSAPPSSRVLPGASLPIAAYREAIVEAVTRAPVTVLVGETGSGKTTQVPQFLFTAGLASGPHHHQHSHPKQQSNASAPASSSSAAPAVGRGQIVVTQPRRVAAITVARRVASEMGTSIGSGPSAGTVGFSVRFEDATGHATRIKFATDGMLLRCVGTSGA